MEMRTNKFMIYVFSAIMLGGMVACSSDDPETDTGNGNGNGGNAEIAKDLDQGVNLVLFANGTDFKKSEASVHREHHDGTQQDEQHVAAGLDCFHRDLGKMNPPSKASTIPVHQNCYKSVRYVFIGASNRTHLVRFY